MKESKNVILLIDESEELHVNAEKICAVGYTVDITHSGPYALQKFKSVGPRYDAIVIGKSVRGIKQQELADAMRKEGPYPKIPILCLADVTGDITVSTEAMLETVQRAMRMRLAD